MSIGSMYSLRISRQVVLFCFFSVIGSSFFGCKSSAKLSNENLTSQLFYQAEIFSPHFAVYHKSVDTTMIYFSIDEKDLLFVNNGADFTSKLNIQYSVFDTYSSSIPTDSGSVSFSYLSRKEMVAVKDSFVILKTMKEGSILHLKFIDVNRNAESARSVRINSKSKLSNQSFLMYDEQGRICYDYALSGPSTISLVTDFPGVEALWVRCFFKEYPLASLPFRVIDDEKFRMQSDSTFYLYKSNFSSFSIKRPGIFYFQTDTQLLSGLAITCFDDDFPKVTRTEQLIEATRYLTTRKEYGHLMTTENKKAELDALWLAIGGSPDRARGLIRAYYNRVQDANRVFTSYMEGWKTDRGMIFIILGEPLSIYRDDETEQWTYTGLPGFPDLLFIFRKMNNPFTNNDYALIRQPVYENVWYLAVDQWRQGRVVNDN